MQFYNFLSLFLDIFLYRSQIHLYFIEDKQMECDKNGNDRLSS